MLRELIANLLGFTVKSVSSKYPKLQAYLNLALVLNLSKCNLSQICDIKIRDQVSYLGIIIRKDELERGFNPLIESERLYI